MRRDWFVVWSGDEASVAPELEPAVKQSTVHGAISMRLLCRRLVSLIGPRRNDARYPSSQVAILCGLGQETLVDWIQRRIVEPMVRGRRGQGCRSYFNHNQFIAAAAAITARRNGASLTAVSKIYALVCDALANADDAKAQEAAALN